MILTKLQATAALATLRAAPLGSGEVTVRKLVLPEGRFVFVEGRQSAVRVNELGPAGQHEENYTSVDDFAVSYGLEAPGPTETISGALGEMG